MPTVTNVSTGKPKVAGAVFRAPAGTTLPTDATTALNNAFVDLGYISEDGVVNDNNADSEEIKAWGGQTVMVSYSSKTDTWKMTFIEATNAEVLKTVYGSSNVTTGTGTITVNANSAEPTGAPYVIDMALRGGAMKRVVIPNGVLSELGEITYKDDEAIGYEVTLNALPDASGNTHYEYIKLAS